MSSRDKSSTQEGEEEEEDLAVSVSFRGERSDEL